MEGERMRVTFKLLGTEVLSVELGRTPKLAPEVAAPADEPFGFHGGRGPTINERAPIPGPVRRRNRNVGAPLNPQLGDA